jgi:3-phosphoshikimate 1-carboxyvinyltransferase
MSNWKEWTMALRGHISLPGDKSISHRALMLSSLSGGTSRLTNLNTGADVNSTRSVLEACGIHIESNSSEVWITGKGLRPFSQPNIPLHCGNSGTTARLMLGLLAAHPLHLEFTGDTSLSKRPMARVIRPLQQAGANIHATQGKYLPIMLGGRDLWALRHELTVSSAQVKSALILAGLWAQGETVVRTPLVTRDHTERMLEALGARIKTIDNVVHVAFLEEPLNILDGRVPGDFSSAAFFLAAALLAPGSDISLKFVGVNPTRTAFLAVLQEMGASISIEPNANSLGEPVADLHIQHTELEGIDIDPDLIPNLIDEIPLLAVLATQAHGTTRIRGAGELRVKESDRIEAMVTNLKNWGVKLEEFEDGFHITGPQQLKGGKVQSFGDHRIAMAMTVAGLGADQIAEVDDPACIDISFPEFPQLLRKLQSGD